ncbi:MAG: methylenetetrahydrofolate reductase [NAD(P)H] [Candidatus Competibacterales bacterium]
MESQRRFTPTLSCEFFPPNDVRSLERLEVAYAKLRVLRPAYVSVTYGAGGSTQDRTFATVEALQGHSAIPVAPHLTCVGSTRGGVRAILERYRRQGIERLVALRGDLPSGNPMAGELRYASDLVAFIRETMGDAFHIEVAAYPEFHPQCQGAAGDLLNLKRKVEAGADAAITQYFFNADAYFRLVDSLEALGVTIPVVPGIMPIANYQQLARFSERCGAEIPRWLHHRLADFGDDTAALRAFGVEVVADICRRLLEQGAPGLHFYTLNRADPTLAIWRALGEPRFAAPEPSPIPRAAQPA